jgi:acetyl esterase/lipase
MHRFESMASIFCSKMLDDICYALIHVRQQIQQHCPQADPDQLFLSGHSAGAHLISLLLLDPSHLQRHQIPYSSIRGAILSSGIYSLANPTHDSLHHIRNWIFRLLYSINLVYPRGKSMNDYSPIEHIRDRHELLLPPILVLSARFDMGLEVDAQRFIDRLSQHHQTVQYRVIGGMTTHGTIASRFSKNEAHQHFFAHLRENIKY